MAAADADETFFALFETLSWLDTLLLRRDAGLPREGTGEASEVIAGLRFVRGRVHHQWLGAVELRTDVSHPVSLGFHVPSRTFVDSVILLPLTLIASVFGMNVHFPGFGTSHAFWVLVGAMVVTIVGMGAFFRSKRWL